MKNTQNKIALSFFCVWFLLLTGVFNRFFGSPGILQAVQLKSLLNSKNQQLVQVESDLKRLEVEMNLLKSNRYSQEKEIRRVLGYAASDEIIFDFTQFNRN